MKVMAVNKYHLNIFIFQPFHQCHTRKATTYNDYSWEPGIRQADCIRHFACTVVAIV